MPHRGECAFNGVGGPQVLPMLSREVVKRQQRLAVLRQATHRLVVLDGVGLDKGVESGVGVVLRLGHPDVLQSALGFWQVTDEVWTKTRGQRVWQGATNN